MGASLKFKTYDPTVFAPLVEQVVRGDVGSALALKYVVHDLHAPKPSGFRARFSEALSLEAGAGVPLLARVDVQLPWHLPAFAMVSMSRVGGLALATSLTFLVRLGRPVDRAALERPRMGAPLFVGGVTAERLNRIEGLPGRAKDVLRDESAKGTIVRRVRASFQIGIDEGEPTLAIVTLPGYAGRLWPSDTTDAGKVIALAREIEAALPP